MEVFSKMFVFVICLKIIFSVSFSKATDIPRDKYKINFENWKVGYGVD